MSNHYDRRATLHLSAGDYLLFLLPEHAACVLCGMQQLETEIQLLEIYLKKKIDALITKRSAKA